MLDIACLSRILAAMNIVTARKNAGLTQQQLADRLGVTRSAVANWESGVGRPDINSALAIRRVLGLSLEQIYDADSEAEEAA